MKRVCDVSTCQRKNTIGCTAPKRFRKVPKDITKPLPILEPELKDCPYLSLEKDNPFGGRNYYCSNAEVR